MIVVSDASPLISLATISQLEILRRLFGNVVLPAEVFREITGFGSEMPGADEVREASWIQVLECEDIRLVKALSLQLDPGEAEAIVLAIQLQADLLLMDERMGRRVAKEFGLPITGILGVLSRAKQEGILPAVKPTLDRLIQEAGYRIGKDLYEEILKTEGET